MFSGGMEDKGSESIKSCFHYDQVRRLGFVCVVMM